MKLGPGIEVDDARLRQVCVAHGVRRLALFGSTVRGEHRLDSDIDLLVEFQPGRTPGLLGIAELEMALEELLGRTVEVRTPADLSRYFRYEVSATARTLYDAA